MSRYFKFRTLDDIAQESERLGLSLEFTADLSALFRPVQVGNLQVGNSLCIQPMEGCDAELDGSPGELTFRRFRRFGSGGAKLIWGEAAAVVDEGRANPRQLLLTASTAPKFAELVRQCRQAHCEALGRDDDLVVGLQLTHSGRYSYRRPIIAMHDPLLDPRTIVDKSSGRTVDATYSIASDLYLLALADYYVSAARIAFEAGFQFVDIKQCHRYLLNELLAGRTRPGQFGGSFENRTRLARTIIKRIRAEVPGLMLASRLNVFDGIPYHKAAADAAGEPDACSLPVMSAWGTDENDPYKADLTEPIMWIAEMRKLGVQLLNVSSGNPYASPHILRPFEYPPPDGYETPEHPLVGVDRHFRLAGAIQEHFPDLPVVGSGYSYLQEFLFHAGAANSQKGRITFVGVGRAALAQPDFARQLLAHGQLDRKRVCRTFSYCTALMRSKHNELGQFATGCPPFDKEVYGPIWKEANGERGV